VIPTTVRSADEPVSIEPRRQRPPITNADLPKPLLRIDAPLVLVPVYVSTPSGGPARGLKKESFQVLEDGVAQKVSYFGREDAPVSVGILFDASGSMQNKMEKSSQAAAAFFRRANPEDEFFLVAFNDRPRLRVPFTANTNEIYEHIVHTRPAGRTSLLDAIHVAMVQMKNARNFRKAIVILSDGGDNFSHHNVREVKRALMESDIQVYAMGIFDRDYMVKHPSEEKRGPQLLDDLTEATGGRNFRVDDIADLPGISSRIAEELRDEYVLGFFSSNPATDGKYRGLTVTLTQPPGSPYLKTYYRRGYYSLTE
jgi:Ca-activated chloride channel family protein